MVKIICMVKNEVDIIQDWVLYHASLVGLNNITVLDNESTDGSFQLLKRLGVQCVSVPDYKQKGRYTTQFIRRFRNELVVPLDMDEFLVYYERGTNILSCDKVAPLLHSLKVAPVYRMNYVDAMAHKESSRATVEFKRGEYRDYGIQGKCFFHSKVFVGQVDHGNHYPTPHYVAVPFVLVHYHNRNRAQLVQKTMDNLTGLGYDVNNVTVLQNAITNHLPGNHHAHARLTMLDGSFVFPTNAEGSIDLQPLVSRIIEVTTKAGIVGVVARYNETLDWMKEEPFNQLKYIVYNKGTNEDFCKSNVVSIVQLPNVGRCDHTFLYHVVQHYNKPSRDNVVVFLPGSIDMAFKKERASKLVRHVVATGRAAFIVIEWGNVRNRFKDFTLDEWNCTHPVNLAMNTERALTPSKIRPFGAWYDAHFGSFQSNFYTLYGILSVSPAVIHKRHLHEYQSLLNETAVSSNPEVGHYLERAWGAVFKGPFDML
jgi:hypothetical protein